MWVWIRLFSKKINTKDAKFINFKDDIGIEIELSYFDNNLDSTGAEFKPVRNQGLFGMTLDEFLNSINFIPSHIKIDVDDDENFILEGSKKTLKSANLKSLLVELDETRSDYEKLLEVISSSGLILKEKLNSDIFKGTRFSNTYNHIFKRGNSLWAIHKK